MPNREGGYGGYQSSQPQQNRMPRKVNAPGSGKVRRGVDPAGLGAQRPPQRPTRPAQQPFLQKEKGTVMKELQYPVRPGRYRHFKGNEYQVLGVARHSETEEEMVVYRALYGERGLWVRPAAMWCETVERDGKVQPRFVRIEE